MSTPTLSPTPTAQTPVEYGKQLGRGFLMGAADIVPGVSGGTVALVLGIYDRLIHNVRTGAHGLRQLISGDGRGFVVTLRKIEWPWIITLLAGIFLAVATLSSLISKMLEEQPEASAGLFFGLIVGSVWVAWRLIARTDAAVLGIAAATAVALFLFLGLRADTEVADDAAEVVTQPFWIFFLAGAVAICAMILPGISGSFILVMLGMYTEVLGAVTERDYLSMLSLVAGCVVGLAAFSTLLNWLLERYRDWVLASMIGLMIGSTRVLWPWPNGVDSTKLSAPSGDVALPIVLAIGGAVLVVAVEMISNRIAKHN